jgi:hypothetical protein
MNETLVAPAKAALSLGVVVPALFLRRDVNV